MLAVFGALLLAVALSNQLAKPLLLLAEGVRQVAQGDLSVKPVFASRDELGGLTRSFARMTEQLSEARALVHRSVVQVEGARTNLQTILDNLTAGVIVFDRDGRIDTVNPGATRIVRLPLSAYRGKRLDEIAGLGAFSQAVWQRFELHAASPEAGERDHWQDSFELNTIGPDGRARESITLLVRGAAMPHGARLMVFDDITELVSAQRSEAWSEVARRLAHEIKNPLTPIQLSAERIEHKLGPKLEGSDQAMLARSVATIVNQVQSMKALVNEFRDYARLPASKARADRPQRAGAGGARPVRRRAGKRPPARDPGAGPADDQRRQHAAPPGHPQPGAERARCRGRPARWPGARRDRGRRATRRARCARCACRCSTTGRASRRRC